MEKTNTSTNFTWIKFFNAMLKKICSEYDKKTLWEVFKKVYAGKLKFKWRILTENPGEIDPFTFIAMLNANDSIESRQELCSIVKEELKLSEPSPLDFNGMTFFNPIQRFFYNLNDSLSDTMDSLWELASYVVNNTEIISDEIGETIDITIQDVDYPKLLSWVKICKILFICFPDRYFPADTKICAYSGIKSRLDNFEDFKKYQQALKDKFNEPPYIVSYKAINGIYDNISYNVQNTEAKMTTIKQDTPLIPLNQILYGPPGTGKTYNTVIKAMEIINPACIKYDEEGNLNYADVKKAYDEAKKNGQIEFVTFHQSYAYEEFVEGIKPDLTTKDLKYILKDGIFKTICNNAQHTDNFEEVYNSFINELRKSEKYSEENPFPLKTPNQQIEFWIYPNNSNNLTLFIGADKKNQGTLTKEAIQRRESSYWLSSSYYTAVYEYLQQYKGLTLTSNSNKPYVLIIDEINRGNISKIFGELITLIEPDKRQGESHAIEVKLPYSKDKFSVPKNLYIIGTMNTSDRSIATVDIALRRRFKFIEMMPDKNLVADFGIGFQGIFEKLNKKIKLLLDRDHQIGHSYFINTKYGNANAETLKTIWFQEILPLLNEYFYCDWEKLKLVVPGFITKVVDIPAELKDECEDSAYEFKTEDDFKDIEDFTNALKQDKFEKGN